MDIRLFGTTTPVEDETLFEFLQGNTLPIHALQLNGNVINRLPPYTPSLSLTVQNLDDVSDDVLHHATKIRVFFLSLENCQRLMGLSNIESLLIENFYVRRGLLPLFESLPRLKSIQFDNHFEFSPKDLEIHILGPQVMSRLEEISIGPRSWHLLKQMPKLKHLVVQSDCYTHRMDAFDPLPFGIQSLLFTKAKESYILELVVAPGLQSLTYSSYDSPQHERTHFIQFPRLRELRVNELLIVYPVHTLLIWLSRMGRSGAAREYVQKKLFIRIKRGEWFDRKVRKRTTVGHYRIREFDQGVYPEDQWYT